MVSETILQLKELDSLIEEEKTGNTLELAQKMGLPIEAVYTYLRFLMNQGVRIHFDTQRNTYYYDPYQDDLEVTPGGL